MNVLSRSEFPKLYPDVVKATCDLRELRELQNRLPLHEKILLLIAGVGVVLSSFSTHENREDVGIEIALGSFGVFIVSAVGLRLFHTRPKIKELERFLNEPIEERNLYDQLHAGMDPSLIQEILSIIPIALLPNHWDSYPEHIALAAKCEGVIKESAYRYLLEKYPSLTELDAHLRINSMSTSRYLQEYLQTEEKKQGLTLLQFYPPTVRQLLFSRFKPSDIINFDQIVIDAWRASVDFKRWFNEDLDRGNDPMDAYVQILAGTTLSNDSPFIIQFATLYGQRKQEELQKLLKANTSAFDLVDQLLNRIGKPMFLAYLDALPSTYPFKNLKAEWISLMSEKLAMRDAQHIYQALIAQLSFLNFTHKFERLEAIFQKLTQKQLQMIALEHDSHCKKKDANGYGATLCQGFAKYMDRLPKTISDEFAEIYYNLRKQVTFNGSS